MRSEEAPWSESRGQAGAAPTVVRLHVSYRSARSLVTEYTACLARGGCLLVTRRAVEVGSLFRFEMVCQEQAEAVELEGEVVRVRPIHGDTMSYELAVQYRSHTAQAALEELLARIGTDDTHSHQIVRRFPRIPVNLPAEDSQGLGRRYLIRDLSGGGMRLEAIGVVDAMVGSRVLLGVRFGQQDPLAFLPGSLAWRRATADANRFHLGVKFAELEELTEAQRRALRELTRLRRPSQVFVHLVEPLLRHTQRVTLAASHRQVDQRELGTLVSELARRELTVKLGMALVDTNLTHMIENEHSCVARVGFTGDLMGEIRLRASLELCAAIAAQIGGEMVPLDDRAALGDTLRELVVSLGGALCDRLEAAGYDVAMTPPSLETPASAAEVARLPLPDRAGDLGALPGAQADDLVHSVSMAGMRGIAVLSVHSRAASPAARR